MPRIAPPSRPTSERSASTLKDSSRRWRATMVAPSAVNGKRRAVKVNTAAA